MEMKHTTTLKRLLCAAMSCALLLSVTAFAPFGAKAALTAAPACGDHEGWVAIGSEEDFDDYGKFIFNYDKTEYSNSGTRVPTDNNRWLRKDTRYYLTADVAMSSPRCLYAYANAGNKLGEATFCLNGHTLNGGTTAVTTAVSPISGKTGIDAQGLIVVSAATSDAPRTLNILDCQGGGKITVNQDAGVSKLSAIYVTGAYATLNWYGGAVEDCYADTYAGGSVRVYSGATLNMYDGAAIRNCKGVNANQCRDVYLTGASVVNMYGGTMESDSNQTAAVRLYSSATGAFNMYGGSITDAYGSFKNESSSAKVRLYGGAVSGAVTAGAVYYPVKVNGTELSATTPAAPGTYGDARYTYDVAGATLTLTDPDRITALEWEQAVDLTVKADADGTTGALSSVPAGSTLTVDLNGHTLTASAAIANAGTLTVTDTSTARDGKLIAEVSNTGAGVLSDPYGLVAAPTEPPAPPAPNTEPDVCSGDHTGFIAIGSEDDFAANAASVTGTAIYLREGDYYLSGDVTVTRSICLNGGREVTLCLNGHTLTGDTTAFSQHFGLLHVWSGEGGCVLNVCDCSAEGNGKIRVNTDQARAAFALSVGVTNYAGGERNLINFCGGSIFQSYVNNEAFGGVVRIAAGGRMDMYDGAAVLHTKPTGSYKCRDIRVQNNGVLNMYGGVLESDMPGTGFYAITINDKASAGEVNIYGGTIDTNLTGAIGYADTAYTMPVTVYGGSVAKGAKGKIKYPVTVNGTTLTAVDPVSVGTFQGDGFTYETEDSTLTVTEPDKIASLAWEGGFPFTLKLGEDWLMTDALSAIPAGKALTLDLNGHLLTAARGISVAGALTVIDTSADAAGELTGAVETTGAGVLSNPQGLPIGGTADVPQPVWINGVRLTTLTASGTGFDYDPDTATLTVSQPDKIASLVWEEGFGFTVKLAGDWTTDQFAQIGRRQSLTLDLNGRTLTAEGGFIVNYGTLTVTDTSDGHGGALVGTVVNAGEGVFSNPLSLPIAAETLTVYSVSVNGAALDTLTAAGDGYSYDAASGTLTVTDPTKITALEWDGALTVKPGADWTTRLFAAIPAGKTLTLDLNGCTLTAAGDIENAGTLTVTDTSADEDGALAGRIFNRGVLNNPKGLALDAVDVVNHPVTVNGARLDTMTAAGEGYAYDAASGTLTVTDPTKITALEWDGALTVKLGADWACDLFHGIPEGKTLTLDLNGHTLTAAEGIFNGGTLTVTDTSGATGALVGTVTNLGAAVLNDPLGLVTVAGTVTYHVRVNGAALTNGTVNGDGYTYDPLSGVLAVSDPSKITALDWDADAYLTLQLGADWDTAANFDPLADFGAKVLTLDLNGHVIGKEGYSAETPVENDLTVNGTLTVMDSTATTEDGVPGISAGALKGYRIITDGSAAKLTLESGVITDGYYGGTENAVGGGAVYCMNQSTFIMNGGRITANGSLKNGGGVCVRNGKFTMNDGRVDHNAGGRYGGGIAVVSGTAKVNGGLIDSNTTGGDGANARGGGFAALSGTVTLGAATLTHNVATEGAGGGAVFYGGTYTLNGTVIAENTSASGGAGLHVMSGATVTANDVTVRNNTVSGTSKSGGGILVEGALTLNGGSVTGNVATNVGGGVYVESGKSLTVNGTTVTGNTAVQGGGLYVKGTVRLNSGVVDRNVVSAGSGTATVIAHEIYVVGANAALDIYGGTVSHKGSALTNTPVYVYSGKVNLYGGTIYTTPYLGGTNGQINVYGGRYQNVTYGTNTGGAIKVYGGKSTKGVTELIALSDFEYAFSGDPDFPYMPAPKADFNTKLNETETSLTFSCSAADGAWSYYRGGTETQVVTPATAKLTLGERVVTDLVPVKEGGRYTVSVPVTQEDYGKQFELVVFDGEGEGIRAFAGHFAGSEKFTLSGDADGDGTVSVTDVVRLKRYLAGGYGVTLTTAQGDMDGNGVIEAKDATALTRYMVGNYGQRLKRTGNSDHPANDNEFNVLLLGNSYSYYWTDELYGLLTAAGYENVSVCNIYYSGCTFAQHWDWFLSGAGNYYFYVVDATGRHTVGGAGTANMLSCVEYKNWDVIGLQQSGKYMYASGGVRPDEHVKSVKEHLPLLYNYLMLSRFPDAEYVWQQHWVHEIPYANDGVETAEDIQYATDAYRASSYDFCEQYGFTNVPCGDAWQKVRTDPLIAFDGRLLTTRINNGTFPYDDYSHDGDVGGGQYVNACCYFEAITKTSCVGNTFRPSYVYKGQDLSLSQAQIDLLQNAAHEAVMECHGAGFYQN